MSLCFFMKTSFFTLLYQKPKAGLGEEGSWRGLFSINVFVVYNAQYLSKYFDFTVVIIPVNLVIYDHFLILDIHLKHQISLDSFLSNTSSKKKKSNKAAFFFFFLQITLIPHTSPHHPFALHKTTPQKYYSNLQRAEMTYLQVSISAISK